MAKINARRCKGGADDSPCELVIVLLVLHALAFIALVTFINWNFCHQKGKGPCRIESSDDGNYMYEYGGTYDYVRTDLTSAEKKKCKKYKSGIAIAFA